MTPRTSPRCVPRRAQTRPASGAAAPGAPFVALEVSHSLKLVSGGGAGGEGAAGVNNSGSGGTCYALALESAAPLFAVGIACSRELRLLDAPGNVAILSRWGPGV